MSEPVADAASLAIPQPPPCKPSDMDVVDVTASPGPQVQVGTTVQLSGTAKNVRILPSCEIIERNVPFQWSLTFQAPGGPVVDVTSSLKGANTLNPSFLANDAGTYGAVISASFSTYAAEAVITATLPPPIVLTVSGHVTSLRVNDIGDGFGPADDFIEVEAVAQLDTQEGKNFGFQLRNDKNRPARQSMFDLLLDAFNNNWTVTLDCLIIPGKNNGTILQVTLTKS